MGRQHRDKGTAAKQTSPVTRERPKGEDGVLDTKSRTQKNDRASTALCTLGFKYDVCLCWMEGDKGEDDGGDNPVDPLEMCFGVPRGPRLLPVK